MQNLFISACRTTFKVETGKALFGYNDVHLVKVSITDCKQHCRQGIHDNLECKSFNYNILREECHLSSESKDTKPEAFGYKSEFFYYHKRTR